VQGQIEIGNLRLESKFGKVGANRGRISQHSDTLAVVQFLHNSFPHTSHSL
jgi:hypothetical protein